MTENGHEGQDEDVLACVALLFVLKICIDYANKEVLSYPASYMNIRVTIERYNVYVDVPAV